MTLQKAMLQNLSTRERFEVLYNPTDYTSSTEVQTAQVGAMTQFQRVASPTFTVNLFFDTYEKQSDVRDLLRPIAALQQPTVGTQGQREPPTCLFSWGGFQYTGMLTKLDQKFTMFLPSGIPVRAELTVTLTQIQNDTQAMEEAGLPNCRKLHIVAQHDRLDLLAYRYLGNATLWPQIAALNGILDPLAFPTDLQVGQTLVIPDTEEAASWA